ncbi:MAG: hypothetical protein EOO75_06475 [Myxococcales bacterium]|nr:MAG: hypothetical protein EOO75_06475 [Myxococcales bacterium]
MSLGVGCGGALPLLHSAHVEPEGAVTVAAGVAGQVVVGDPARRLQQAREQSVAGAAPPPSAAADYRRAALVVAALAPGVSPFVGARVGLGWQSEAGVTYSGRALRLDARHAFQDGSLALSVGLGGHALLARPGSEPGDSLRGLELDGVKGYGLDVPVIAGWRSDGGLVSLWAGVRGGLEQQRGEIVFGDGTATTPFAWSARRWWGGGLVGLMAGFRHVFVALELDASYHDASATAGDTPLSLSGVTLAPAAALLGKF